MLKKGSRLTLSLAINRVNADSQRPTKSLRVRHKFLRDFSRPIEISQYQIVLILHRHI